MALVEYNLNDIARNIDYTTHCLISTDTWSDNFRFDKIFASLKSHWGDDYNLISKSQRISYSNGEFEIGWTGQSNATACEIGIPLKQNYKITKISMDVKLNARQNAWTCFVSALVSASNQEMISNASDLVIWYNPSDGYDSSNPVHELCYDSNYHTYIHEFATPINANYITLATGDTYAWIKNIKITVEEVGGGAGSGYIGNSLLSNKKMVGYNVPTSDTEGTKTESVNDVSASPVSGKPKSGNGFARIKFLRAPDISNMTEWTPDADFGWSVTYDDTTKENHVYGQGNEYWEYFECPISVKKNTNYVLSCQYKGTGITYSTSNRDYLRIFNRFVAESEIRNNNGLYGISGLTIIAESSDYFDNNSTYRNISVSFNSGNLSEVWACIGFGYGDYDANTFDVYFKNIQLTEV